MILLFFLGTVTLTLARGDRELKKVFFLKSTNVMVGTDGNMVFTVSLEPDSFYRTLIGNHTQSIEWYHFQ